MSKSVEAFGGSCDKKEGPWRPLELFLCQPCMPMRSSTRVSFLNDTAREVRRGEGLDVGGKVSW